MPLTVQQIREKLPSMLLKTTMGGLYRDRGGVTEQTALDDRILIDHLVGHHLITDTEAFRHANIDDGFLTPNNDDGKWILYGSLEGRDITSKNFKDKFADFNKDIISVIYSKHTTDNTWVGPNPQNVPIKNIPARNMYYYSLKIPFARDDYPIKGHFLSDLAGPSDRTMDSIKLFFYDKNGELEIDSIMPFFSGNLSSWRRIAPVLASSSSVPPSSSRTLPPPPRRYG